MGIKPSRLVEWDEPPPPPPTGIVTRDAASASEPVDILSQETQTEEWTAQTLKEHFLAPASEERTELPHHPNQIRKPFGDDFTSLYRDNSQQPCSVTSNGDAWLEYEEAIQSFWNLDMSSMRGLTPVNPADVERLSSIHENPDVLSYNNHYQQQQRCEPAANRLIVCDKQMERKKENNVSSLRSEMKGGVHYCAPSVISKIRMENATRCDEGASSKRTPAATPVPNRDYVDIVTGNVVDAPFTTAVRPSEYIVFLESGDTAIREFFDGGDRRISSICHRTNCRLYFHLRKGGQPAHLFKGLHVMPVVITGRTHQDIKKCLRFITSKYTQFQAIIHHRNPDEFNSR